MLYAVLVAASLGAGIIQSVTGFGAGIFIMLFLPYFVPVLTASAMSGTITLILNIALSWRFRKDINARLTLMPAVFFIIASSVAMYFAPYAPRELMLRILGGFLVILSIYFLFFPDKIKIKASLPAASVCASLSGIFGGLFGIGGPPMVIYFLAASKGKEEYLGTIQFFFTITGIYTFLFRIGRGIYTFDLLPLTLLGIVGIIIGKEIGTRIVDRIDIELMKKLVYIFLAISGVINLF